MFQALAYGIISASGATIFQQLLLIVLGIEIFELNRLTPLLIFVAISEEIFKLIFIYQLGRRRGNFSDLFFSALFLGLGFSLMEISLKIWNSLEKGNFLWSDYLGVILLHILTAGIIGLFLERKWKPPVKILIGLTIASIIHLAYNALRIYLF